MVGHVSNSTIVNGLQNLHLTARTIHVLCRRVSFNAKLLPGEKVEYVRHGDCITVKLMNLPANFWYSSTVSRRFAIDPAEFDAEYQAGVAKVEKGISANPELWKTNWINQNISRCAPSHFWKCICVPHDLPTVFVDAMVRCLALQAVGQRLCYSGRLIMIQHLFRCRIVRAKAIRSFLSNSKAHINPTTYYRHFQSLCKGIQKLHPPISHDESEKAYELGCARTVGCATAVTFKMLTALPKDTMCAYGHPTACAAVICHSPQIVFFCISAATRAFLKGMP